MAQMEYDWAVVIGRFQPMHKAHVKVIERALIVSKKVIIVLGSHKATQTIKNPFTSSERQRMIEQVFAGQAARFSFVSIRDFPYNDDLWIADVQSKVAKIASGKITIVGCISDETSYYLRCFPQWKATILPLQGDFHATDIRNLWYSNTAEDNLAYRDLVPDAVFSFMEGLRLTPRFTRLVEEYEFIRRYKSDWARAPYPPTFVTIDAVVVKSGHVLVVRRRSSPGKGLWALPGGFLSQNETIAAGRIREVHEETGLHLRPEQMIFEQVFDDPNRSLRGRTITHAAKFDLGSGPLDAVKGGDDADAAVWMPLAEIFENEELFFDDHAAIIQELINK